MDVLTATVFGTLGLAVGLVVGLLTGHRLTRRSGRGADDHRPGADGEGVTGVDGAASAAVAELRRLLEDARVEDRSSTARVDARLEGLAGELARMQTLVQRIETGRAEQFGDLSRHLEHAVRTTGDLATTTRDLQQALAGSNARGQWGERMAEDVLRAAGLVEGVNYVRHHRLPGGGVPDVTLLLPQGRRLHMDVKFPVAEYLRLQRADDDVARARHRAAFLRDARARVAELAGRGYGHEGEGVGVVLLLIPNEAVFSFLAQHAPQLFDEAMSEGVTVCSPLTLFAVLAVVRQAVDSVHLAEASGEIRELLGAVEHRWRALATDLDKLGTHLRHATGVFDQVNGGGRRELERALERAATPLPAADGPGVAAPQPLHASDRRPAG